MRKGSVVIALILGMVTLSARPSKGSWFTPLEWQSPVDTSVAGANRDLYDQRKHTQWVRDRNHDFVDDMIDLRKTDDSVNVIVELNRCYEPGSIAERFHGFGRVQYIGRVLTFALLEGVPVARLRSLANRPDVAMVELQVHGKPLLPYTARSVESRKSSTYPGRSAEEHPPTALTGAGVTIAFLDTGVDDYDATTGNGHDALPTSRFGYDAIVGTDTGDGKTNPCASEPSDCTAHGTLVAGVALSRGVGNIDCYPYLTEPEEDEKTATAHCVGVAPGANLVDIRVCQNDDCAPTSVFKGLDWLVTNADADGIRVANISIGLCIVDDDTSALCKLVDYAVSMGITVVVGHGNHNSCPDPSEVSCDPIDPKSTWWAMPPGSAAKAITVSGVQDSGSKTVTRSDDTAYANGLEGPLCKFDPTKLDREGLKPDISAPAYNVLSTNWSSTKGHDTAFDFESGTSVASPHVAGAAAIIIEARPSIDPASLKDLLMTTADATKNQGYDTSLAPPWNHWDRQLGMGMLNIGDALDALDKSTADVGFPSCTGDPGTVGSPCQLGGSQPSWLNTTDILVSPSTPVAGVENTITAHVQNFGTTSATVQVGFGIYDFGTGTRSFYELGRQTVEISPSEIKEVSQTWTPSSNEHQCVQVNIGYGADTKYWNNTTQRNLTVVPASSSTSATGSANATTSGGSAVTFHAPPPSAIMRVENPFMVPATFYLATKVNRKGWKCLPDRQSFTIDPAKDCPQDIGIRVVPPRAAPAGDTCNCDVYVRGGAQKRLVGGVTVRAVVPRKFTTMGQVVGQNHRGAPGKLEFIEAWPFQTGGTQPPVIVDTDSLGNFSVKLDPHLAYRVKLRSGGFPTREIGLSPGQGNLRIELTPEKARVLRTP